MHAIMETNMDDMSKVRAARILQQFLSDPSQGEEITRTAYLARCPESERKDMMQAFGLLDEILLHYSAPPPSPGASERAIRTIQKMKGEKQVADLRRRAADLASKWADSGASGGMLAYAQELLGVTGDRFARALAAPSQGPALLVQNRGAVTESGAASGRQAADTLLADLTLQRAAERRAREAAENALAQVGDIAKPVDPHRVAETLGLFVQEMPLKDRDGCLFRRGDLAAVLLNRDIASGRRRRFTLAHEIGHYLLHADVVAFEEVVATLMDFHSLREREANLFASRLLMPASLMPTYKDADGPSVAQAELLQEEFDVSLAAALVRVVQDADWDCAVVASENGFVQWWVRSEHFAGFIPRGKRLLKGTEAEAMERTQKEGTVSASVQAALWLGDTAEQAWLKEESRRTKSGRVYTLLTLAAAE